jgi:hypothetical protein
MFKKLGKNNFFGQSLNLNSLSGGGNFFENLISDVLNLGLQSGTGGLLGFQDGQIGNGVSTDILKNTGKGVVSGVKEVTGAKAAEEANKLAREQFEKQKTDILNERDEAIQKTALNEQNKSQMAQAVRSKGTNTGGAGGVFGSSSLGSYERDFLGL